MTHPLVPLKNELVKFAGWDEQNLYLSGERKAQTVADLEAATSKTGLSRTTQAIPLASVREVSYAGHGSAVAVAYRNEKGRDKTERLKLEDAEQARAVGEALGQSLGFARRAEQASNLKPALVNAALAVGALVVTAFLAQADPASLAEGGSTRRSRGRSAMLAMVVDSIGPLGVWAIGLLVAGALAYLAYAKYNASVENVRFVRA